MLSRSNLYAYQERAAQFIKDNRACALWVDCGLGKTASGLTAFSDLLRSFDARRALVVAPLRVSRKVWPEEVQNWQHLNGLRVSKIIGTPKQRWEALNRDADIYVTNREQVEWIEAQFIQGEGRKFKQVRRLPWDTVLIDEASSFKSASSRRWKSLRRLRRLHEIEHFVELTGTPASNGYMDIWAQIFLLDFGRRLGSSMKAFVDRWFDYEFLDSYTRYQIKSHSAAEIQAAIADVVLTLRAEDYLDMPPVVYNNVRVELPEKALQTYKKFEREYLAEVGGKQLTAVNAGVCAGKLSQLANGAVYHDDKSWTEFHSEKTGALLELLESAMCPVLIAYSYKHDLARIKDALSKRFGKERTWAVLDTEEDENRWNAGEIDFLLLHPKSAGHGLNIQYSGSEMIVWFGFGPDLDLYEQMNARLIGGLRAAGKNVVIHHIVAEKTYDEHTLSLLNSKATTQDDLKLALVRLAAGRL